MVGVIELWRGRGWRVGVIGVRIGVGNADEGNKALSTDIDNMLNTASATYQYTL